MVDSIGVVVGGFRRRRLLSVFLRISVRGASGYRNVRYVGVVGMPGFGGVLCWFVCSWVLVLGGVWFLVECSICIGVVFTFVRVGAIANLSSAGSMYRVRVCIGTGRV